MKCLAALKMFLRELYPEQRPALHSVLQHNGSDWLFFNLAGITSHLPDVLNLISKLPGKQNDFFGLRDEVILHFCLQFCRQ